MRINCNFYKKFAVFICIFTLCLHINTHVIFLSFFKTSDNGTLAPVSRRPVFMVIKELQEWVSAVKDYADLRSAEFKDMPEIVYPDYTLDIQPLQTRLERKFLAHLMVIAGYVSQLPLIYANYHTKTLEEACSHLAMPPHFVRACRFVAAYTGSSGYAPSMLPERVRKGLPFIAAMADKGGLIMDIARGRIIGNEAFASVPSPDYSSMSGVWLVANARRFADPETGGSRLAAIMKQLNGYALAGVTCLHLMPIDPMTPLVPSSPYARFACGPDIFEAGTPEDLSRLVEEASKRGITIMFDMVLNHTGHFDEENGGGVFPAECYINKRWDSGPAIEDGQFKGDTMRINYQAEPMQIPQSWIWALQNIEYYLSFAHFGSVALRFDVPFDIPADFWAWAFCRIKDHFGFVPASFFEIANEPSIQAIKAVVGHALTESLGAGQARTLADSRIYGLVQDFNMGIFKDILSLTRKEGPFVLHRLAATLSRAGRWVGGVNHDNDKGGDWYGQDFIDACGFFKNAGGRLEFALGRLTFYTALLLVCVPFSYSPTITAEMMALQDSRTSKGRDFMQQRRVPVNGIGFEEACKRLREEGVDLKESDMKLLSCITPLHRLTVCNLAQRVRGNGAVELNCEKLVETAAQWHQRLRLLGVCRSLLIKNARSDAAGLEYRSGPGMLSIMVEGKPFIVVTTNNDDRQTAAPGWIEFAGSGLSIEDWVRENLTSGTRDSA